MHRDILQIGFNDAYFNNTLKTIGGIKWVVENCQNAGYAMFADDDFYINTFKMKKLLDVVEEGSRTYAFMGNVLNVGPVRNKKDKWYISEKDYPYKKLPAVCKCWFMDSNKSPPSWYEYCHTVH